MQANVREATVNDAKAVFRFFLSQGKVREEECMLWLKRWKLLFQLNPWLSGAARLRQGFVGQARHPIGWVIEGENGAIEGYAGNIILPYVYGGAVYTAGCTTGVVVEPSYRRYSMSMLKGYFIQTGIDIFISSTANEVSGAIFDALKVPKFQVGNYNTMYYFLINPSNVAYAFLRRRMPFFFARPVATFAGAILAFWFYLRDMVAFGRSNMVTSINHHTRTGVGVKIVEKSLKDLDETYDAFWEFARNQKDQLIFLRTREALRWHFAESGNWGAPSVFCYYEEDRMLGYAIIDKHFEKENGILRFRCVDILTLEDKKEIIKRLIGAAYTRAKKEGADLLVCYFFPASVRKVIGALAHMRRKRSGGVYMRILNPKLSSRDVMRKWYATCADGDSAFWSLTAPRL